MLWVGLAGLGMVLLAAGGGATVWPVTPARPFVDPPVVLAAIPSQTAALLPARRAGRRASERTWSGTGTIVLATARGSRRHAACLGTDLAAGRRAESLHLATVPVPRAAGCGAVRDAIRGSASQSHSGRELDAAAAVVATTALSDAASVDRAAAALYGPPDRQPQATQEALLEAGKFDGGRGQARAYLEETAASRFLAP